MTSCQNNIVKFVPLILIYLNGMNLFFFNPNIGEFRIEMYFPPSLNDCVAHGIDDFGKLVGSNMRMGVDQDIGICTKENQPLHCLEYIASLF